MPRLLALAFKAAMELGHLISSSDQSYQSRRTPIPVLAPMLSNQNPRMWYDLMQVSTPFRRLV